MPLATTRLAGAREGERQGDQRRAVDVARQFEPRRKRQARGAPVDVEVGNRGRLGSEFEQRRRAAAARHAEHQRAERERADGREPGIDCFLRRACAAGAVDRRDTQTIGAGGNRHRAEQRTLRGVLGKPVRHDLSIFATTRAPAEVSEMSRSAGSTTTPRRSLPSASRTVKAPVRRRRSVNASVEASSSFAVSEIALVRGGSSSVISGRARTVTPRRDTRTARPASAEHLTRDRFELGDEVGRALLRDAEQGSRARRIQREPGARR